MNTNQSQKSATADATSNLKNLLDTAAANGSFKTFTKAVEHAGLNVALNGQGPFTIFAPTDAAFERLPAGKLDELFKPENKGELTSILNYHVINGRRNAADMGKWDKAKTLHGQAAQIKMTDGTFSIDGALLSASDLASNNGILHGIDKVNMPIMTVVDNTVPAAVAAPVAEMAVAASSNTAVVAGSVPPSSK